MSPVSPSFSFVFAPLPRRGRISPHPPSPAGKGGGGMGERKQPKGRADRRHRGQAPLRTPQRQGRRTANKTSPPRAPVRQGQPVPRGFSRRSTCWAGTVSAANGLMQGCRGRSPRRNKLLVSPFPPGRGLGGWGKESKLKAGQTGDIEGKPPCGHHSGRVGGRQTKQATPPGNGKARSAGDYPGKPPHLWQQKSPANPVFFASAITSYRL